MTIATIYGFLSMALVATLAPATASAGSGDDDKRKGCGSDDSCHDDERRLCKPRRFYKFHQLMPRNFFVPRTRFVDGPGGTMTVSVTREHEVLAFVEIEDESQKSVTTGDVIRHVRQMELPHLEVRHKIFTGHEYTREISKGMYGNTWYRVFGYRIGWSAWSVLGTCRHVKITSGIANVPAKVEGWRYWETKHPFSRNPRPEAAAEETNRPEQEPEQEQEQEQEQAAEPQPETDEPEATADEQPSEENSTAPQKAVISVVCGSGSPKTAHEVTGKCVTKPGNQAGITVRIADTPGEPGRFSTRGRPARPERSRRR